MKLCEKFCAAMKRKEMQMSAMLPEMSAIMKLRRDVKKAKSRQESKKMVDDKLAFEEEQRNANYEAMKTDVKSDLTSEIASHADQPKNSESQRIENIAGDMRHKAINEIVQTDNEIQRGRALARVSRLLITSFLLFTGFWEFVFC